METLVALIIVSVFLIVVNYLGPFIKKSTGSTQRWTIKRKVTDSEDSIAKAHEEVLRHFDRMPEIWEEPGTDINGEPTIDRHYRSRK